MTRKQRTLIYAGVLLFTIGVITLLIKEDLRYYLRVYPFVILTFGIASILAGISTVLNVYVQGGFTNKQGEDESDLNTFSTVNKQLEKLKQEFNDTISSKLGDLEDKDKIETLVQKHISNITSETVLNKISEQYGDKIISEKKLEELEVGYDDIQNRLSKETARLFRFGNINLMIGFVTTFMAIFFLGYSLLGVKTTETNTTTYLYHLIPRISLSLLIEFFSFFFLRMYKKNLDDMKYFNNERTNIEMRIYALKSAILYGDKDALNLVVQQLAQTERNFILKKDESTVEVEKFKIDTSSSNKLWTNIFKVLEKK